MENEPRAEDHLRQAASFMEQRGISAVLVSGNLNDGRRFEGMSFMTEQSEIGELRFADGEVVDADVEEHQRRLRVAGFVNEVVRPVQRAARSIYREGADLLDERFDVLPGMLD